jgi:hypothetical protein
MFGKLISMVMNSFSRVKGRFMESLASAYGMDGIPGTLGKSGRSVERGKA